MDQEDAVSSLRDQGYRLTPQRFIVLSIVAHGDGHMDVAQVYEQAKEAYPFMDIATVYRALHLFRDLGVVTEVAIGDRMHYELTDSHGGHNHMVCRLCNGAYNLSPHYLEEFRETLTSEFGFEPDLEHFAISGTCANCRETNGKHQAPVR